MATPTASGTTVTKSAGESTPLTALFSYSDLDNDIVAFATKDRELGGGYLTKNGVPQAENTLFDNRPIGEIWQWAFVAGAAGSTSTIGFNAIDSGGRFNPSVVSTVIVAAALKPDLSVTNVSFSNTSVSPGGTLTVNYTLVNSGSAVAGSSTTGLFMSLPDGSSLEFQDSAISVGANSSVQESATITLPTTIPAQSYFLGLFADRLGQINEGNENNNTTTAGPITVAAASKPDLSVTNVSFSNTSVSPGGTLTVNYTLVNSGSAVAGSSTTGLFMSLPDGSLLEFQDSAISVGANSSVQESATITLPTTIPAQSYFLGLFADRLGQINEGNENNNTTTAGPITVAAATTDTVREGTDSTTTLTLGNPQVGTIDAEPIGGDGISLDNQGGHIDKDWYQVTLQKGHTYAFQASSTSINTGKVSISLRDQTGLVVPNIYNNGANQFAEGATASFTFNTNNQANASQIYYLAVSAGGPDPAFRTATGSFIASFTDTTPAVSQDDYRDSAADTTAPLGQIAPGGGARPGVIVPEPGDINGDKDVFAVPLVAGQAYRMTVEGVANGSEPALPAAIFTVRDGANFNTIRGTSSEGASAVLEYTAQTTADHYIRVGAGGANFPTAHGGYTLRVQPATVEDDPGNDIATARDISEEIQDTGAFSYPGRAGGGDPADFFKIVAPKAGQLSVSLSGLSADLDLELQDQSGGRLAISDNLNTASEQLSRKVRAGEIVYVDVRPYGPVQSNYSLNVNFQPSPVTSGLSAEALFGDHKLLTLADFALAAYASSEGVDALARLVDNGRGWDVLGPSELPGLTWNGFYFENGNAAALVARSADALVISFRGTDDDTVFGPDHRQWADMDRYLDLLDPLITAINRIIIDDKTIQDVYVTGHSLGAAMIDPFMYTHPDFNRADSSRVRYEAVTFAHPDFQVAGWIPLVATGAALLAARTLLGPWGSLALGFVGGPLDVAANGTVDFGRDTGNRIVSFHNAGDPINIFDFEEAGLVPADENIFYLDTALILSSKSLQHKMVSYYNSVKQLNDARVAENSIRGAAGVKDFDNFVLPSTPGDSANSLTGLSRGHIIVGGRGDDTYIVHTARGGSGDTIIDFANASSPVGDVLEIVVDFGDPIELQAAFRPGSQDLQLIPIVRRSSGSANEPHAPITIRDQFTASGRIEKVVFGGRTIDLPGTAAGFANWDGKVTRAVFVADTVLREAADGAVTGSIDARGGPGLFDSISFAGVKNSITASLTTGFGWIAGGLAGFFNGGSQPSNGQLAAAAAPAAGDITVDLTGMENVTGGTQADTLIGNAAANRFEGGPGDDLVQAGAGNDTIIGGSGEGDDTYDGGDDIDTVVYSSTTQGIVVDLSAAANHATGPEIGTDQLVSIENVVGGSGSDWLIGDAGPNRLEGGRGNDTAAGGGGFDTYVLNGSRSQFSFAETNGYVVSGNAQGTDTLDGIERFQFNDALVTDDYRGGNTTSGTLAPGGEIRGGDIQFLGDRDWFATVLSSGQAYTIRQNGSATGDGTLGDPYLRLYGSSSSLVAQNDHGGFGLNALLIYAPASSGTYYVGAGAFADSGFGSYNVSIAPTRYGRAGSWTGSGRGADEVGWYVGDFNGDGRDDIFRYLPGTSGADVFLSNGTSFRHSGSWTGSGHDGRWYLGDFNGDGRTDIFRYSPGVSGAEMFLSNGASFVYNGSWTGSGRGADEVGWYVGDFNGDGRDDIFRYLPGTSGADVFLSNGTSFRHSGSWTGSGHDGRWYLGDFNGDGRTDIFRYSPGVSGAEMFLSNGASFVYNGSWTGAGRGTDEVGWYVGDFNGDGRDDIMRYVAGSSGADVFLSNGSAFSFAGSWTGAGHDGRWYIGDFTASNGDGIDEIFRYAPGVSGAEMFLL